MMRTLLTTIILVGVLSASAHEIYVSPIGDDAGSGTLVAPFRSLVRGRTAARKLLEQDAANRVTVCLLEGTYPLTETFVLDQRDARSSYAAYKDARVVVTSARKAAGWQKLGETALPFPAAATGKVWVCDVASEARFETLYRAGKRLPRCRSKGFLVKMTPRPGVVNMGWVDAISFAFLEDYPPAKDYSKVNTRILFDNTKWVFNYLKIGRLDREKRIIIPDCPIGYYTTETETQRKVFLENSPEFLDEPGEWFHDMEQHRLYYWPSDGGAPGDVTYPGLIELVRVEGNGIGLEGITFSDADRPAIQPDDQTGQHEWVFLDKADALVRFRNANDCVVRNCRFTRGQVGLRFDCEAQGNLIAGNHFTGLHGNCLVLAGYGPGTTDVNHGNTICENDFYGNSFETSRSAAIVLCASGGNKVHNNRVQDTAGYSMHILGQRVHWFASRFGDTQQRELRPIRWAEIRKNDFGKRMPEYNHARNNLIFQNELAGQIYISAPGSGTQIQRNFLESIRFDDDNAGGREAVARDNILVTAETEGNSHFINNLFYPTPGRRLFGLKEAGSTPESRQERNVFYAPTKANADILVENLVSKGAKPKPKANWNHNLYISDDADLLARLHVNGRDENSVRIPFQPLKAANGAIAFDSPPLGIAPIAITDIGLHHDPAYERIMQKLSPPVGKLH